MLQLFKKTKQELPQETRVLIAQIHNEFYNAGNDILQEAKNVLGSCEEKDLVKAKRLFELGFKQAKNVEVLNKIRLTKETADFVLYYQINYPTNKFINDEQLNKICSKYNLICGEVSAYKGFVPIDKLDMIESFKISNDDKRENIIRVIKWSYGSEEQKQLQQRIEKMYSDLIIPRSKVFIDNHPAVYLESHFAFIEKYEEINYDSLLICAPQKDMDLSFLKRVGNLFLSAKPVHVPDPVVLQPVKGGYLIVTAWGDEASDENVVNEKMN